MHAVLIEASYTEGLTYLPLASQTESPDTVHLHGSRMGIDEVRSLIREAYTTPLYGTERVFVLAYNAFTEEAQNALLKLLEEPPKTARFYIISERPNLLLSTLRSRLVCSDVAPRTDPLFDMHAFLRLSYGDRLAEIGSSAQKKDEAWLTDLMHAIETQAHDSKDASLIRSILSLKPYFHTPGASKKMILEHLVLLLPSHTKAK
jgi:DNA polymerase III delta prime subunit